MDDIEPYEYGPETNGWIHEDDLPNLERIKDQLQGAIEAIYETGDVAMLESCLDEACHELGMTIKDAEPKIERRNSSLDKWYLELQKDLMSL